MAKAVWNGVVPAESDRCETVEGNRYFPPDSIRREYFRENDTKTFCHWKGEASDYDIVVGDQVNEGTAWHYPSTKEEAKHIEGCVAFWKGSRSKRRTPFPAGDRPRTRRKMHP